MSDILGPANAANAVTTRITETRVFPTIDTWFKPCSTPAAQDGTQIQSLFLNGLLAQLRAAIRGNGLKNDGVTAIVAENNANDAMLLGAIQQLIQRGQCNFVPDTGTADAMVVAPAPALAEYEVGLRLLVLKNPLVAANATTTPTINAGLGPVTIVKNDGSTLGVGDLKKGGLFEIELNGANPARLVSLLTLSDVTPPATPYTGQSLTNGGYYVVDVSQGTDFPLPNPATVPIGWKVRIKAINTPTGFQTSAVSVSAGAASTGLIYRGAVHPNFVLIGNGEGFWFENTGTAYDVLTASQPGSFGIYASNPGGAASAAGTGSNVYMPISAVSESVPGAAKAFNRSATVASLAVPVSGIYQIISATSFVGQSASVQQGQLYIADSTAVTNNYYNVSPYANQSFPADVRVAILTYLKQGSLLSAVINCPSGQNYVPSADIFSVFLQQR